MLEKPHKLEKIGCLSILIGAAIVAAVVWLCGGKPALELVGDLTIKAYAVVFIIGIACISIGSNRRAAARKKEDKEQ